jgi:branched-chain amino acid transport system permease protein
VVSLKQNLLKSKYLGLILLIAFLCGLPFFLSEYRLEIIVLLLINVILVVSFRLITTIGNFNFAHAVMMGVGAYTTALLAKSLGWSFLVILPLGGLCAALVGLIIGFPLIKMRGFYFFIGSFAAGEAIRICWIKFTNPFGGSYGISGIPSASFFNIDLSEGLPFYFLVLAVTILCVWLMYRLDRSRIGDTFKAIRSSEALSESVGINITKYKILAFVIGSFFAGICGVLLAYRLTTVDPSQFAPGVAMIILTWTVVGGMSTFAGPIIGVVVLSLIQEATRTTFAAWMPFIYGIILIATVLFLPGGLESIPKRFFPKIVRVGSSDE